MKDEYIQNKIYTIRGKQVMLDSDLAELYQVETRILNQAVKRNIKRFPEEFMFKLSEEEYGFLKSQFVILKEKSLTSQSVTLKNKRGKHKKYMPSVFTEQGVSMLSAILHSDIAIEISIKIMNAFVNMRKFLLENASIFQKFDYIEKKLIKHDEKIGKIFTAIESKEIKPKQGIFYNGQIFDAHLLVTGLIKKANKNIVLIDNYIDETVLALFSENQKLEVTIYTKNITDKLKLDLKKYNSQFKPIEIKKFNSSHDRFLIIDNKQIYHFGASLKDLGKKWFAFSQFDLNAIEMLNKLKK
ncbi:MAG: ORF6N domain-containing protein [Candidatus Marinimicrobia bacterium]|nr:ORF6N domain-containing protein [Candidatus Neomarinimicrobiota bacterium]